MTRDAPRVESPADADSDSAGSDHRRACCDCDEGSAGECDPHSHSGYCDSSALAADAEPGARAVGGCVRWRGSGVGGGGGGGSGGATGNQEAGGGKRDGTTEVREG